LLYFFENFTLDTDRRELRRDSDPIAVEPQVFDILEYLVRHCDRVVSRDDLIASVWGGRIVSESAVSTRINAVRSAIGDDGESQRLIRTLPRKGFRFVGVVRQVDEEEQPRARRAAASPSSATAAVAPRVEAERRHLTVVSCDFVGLRDLATRLDPEELRTVIGACHACCYRAAARWDGTVARFTDDGATIHFSYPQAHEDDAERAVRAGLDLIARIKRLETGRSIALATRIGIATGLVVLGELSGASGNGTAHDRAAFGQAPALAAALRLVTEPDTVLIAASTHGLLGGLFEYQAVGPLALDGFPSTVPAWLITGANVPESRFDALHKTRLTPFSGRHEELALLLRQWSKARAGEGQVVLISGEPGIGKSRIVAHLAECITEQGRYTRLLYQCSPYYRDTSLYPFAAQLERYAVIAPDDPPTRRLDKLEAIVAIRGPSRQSAIPLLAALLAIPTGERYPPITLTPMQQRRQTLAALLDQLEALAQRQPVLLVFEDVHWADPTSIELLDLMVERTRRLAILTLITLRPEFEPSWAGLANVSALTLQRLGRRDVQAIVGGVAEGRTLPSEVMEQIVSKADGVPLFIEELTKDILESGLLTKDESSYQLSGPLPLLAIPLTLQDSLMARLDRLGPAKEIAQIGAAIGREFPYDLLRAVARIDDMALRDALDRLEAAELASSRGKPPKAAYTFKHALVQDAAYGTLLREPRRALHARIAEAIESQFADIVENQPELLARHCAEAGLTEKAIGFWGQAAERSEARSALVEAVEQFKHALNQIATLPPTPALRQEQIRLQVALITPLLHLRGYAAPEPKAAAERARLLIEQAESLGEPPEDPLLLFSVLYTFCASTYVAFDGDADRKLAAQFLALAEKDGATILLGVGHRLVGSSLLHTGDIAQGLAHYNQAIAFYDPIEHRRLVTRFGHDNRVAALAFRPLAHWLLGYPDAANADIQQSLTYAREIGQAATLMVALTFTCLTHVSCGNYEATNRQTEEAIALADEKAAPLFKAIGMMNQGWLLAQNGKFADAVQMLTSGIVAYRSTEARMCLPLYLSYLAKAHAELGQFDDAWRRVGEAMTEIETTKERWQEAEVHRVAGEIALMSPGAGTAKAQAYFERALQIARQQQAKSWELHAAMSLARLLRDQGKRDEGRNLLAPVYGWFTEGFDTRDLKEAKALLDALAS
jgi:DNA-binding winged helix-turn-helix (wHTH) protein/predicted ATPase